MIEIKSIKDSIETLKGIKEGTIRPEEIKATIHYTVIGEDAVNYRSLCMLIGDEGIKDGRKLDEEILKLGITRMLQLFNEVMYDTSTVNKN